MVASPDLETRRTTRSGRFVGGRSENPKIIARLPPAPPNTAESREVGANTAQSCYTYELHLRQLHARRKMNTQLPPVLNLAAKNFDKLNCHARKLRRSGRIHGLERNGSAKGDASRMSEGSEYRLSLGDELVLGGRADDAAAGDRLRGLTQPDRAFSASLPTTGRIGFAIKDRKKLLGGLVHRGISCGRLEWWIEFPSQGIRRSVAVVHPHRSTGGQ